jgi:GNAT superfamily N-acetyltransferase
MNQIVLNNLNTKEGVSIEDFTVLVKDLYKDFPNVINSKISEYTRSLSKENPFFLHGKAQAFFLFDNDVIVGHIVATYDNRQNGIGVIGFFECKDNIIYAKELFKNAEAFLKDCGVRECHGPINMTVWQNFRVSYPEDKDPFLFEPFTRQYFRDLFLSNGFIIDHENITTTDTLDNTVIKDYEVLYKGFLEQGYVYESINEKNLKKSISDIYNLTCDIFSDAYSFYKISLQEFIFNTEKYMDTKNNPYTFILKNPEGDPIGFFFADVDRYSKDRNRVVLKTMGVLSKYRGMGLGSTMLYFVYDQARKAGANELIFSTMAIDNKRVLSITDTDGGLPIYRKYEVYKKNII